MLVYNKTMSFLEHLDVHQTMLGLIAHRVPDKVFKSEYARFLELNVCHLPQVQCYFRMISNQVALSNSYFVTVNWKPGVQPDQTLGLIRNILSKKWIPQEYYYVYEQRGTDLDSVGTGYHNHFLFIEPDKPRSQIQNEIYSTVKNFVGNKMHVDVRPIKPEWKQDKLDYMLGKKWDPEKDPKCFIDCVFRKKNNLQSLYVSQDCFTKEAIVSRSPPPLEGDGMTVAEH